MNWFTEEELAIAKSVDLIDVATSLGYTVKRVGRFHTLKEMDSMRIYNRNHWFRWSRQYEKGENGGSQIDFLRVFCGMDVKAAVFWLLDFIGYNRFTVEKEKIEIKIQPEVKTKEKRTFILPESSSDNSYLYSYLNHERRINRNVIDFFLEKKLIYETRHYHNIIFKGNDSHGITRFASMRGVFDRDGHSFKCDVAGNDKCYGFNVTNEGNTELIVFEAAIDLMSYMDIFENFESNMIALGMLDDAPLETFLNENSKITLIRFCLDNDKPGRNAALRLADKYYGMGYEVEDCPPPIAYKDYNEWLVDTKNISKDMIVKNPINMTR